MAPNQSKPEDTAKGEKKGQKRKADRIDSEHGQLTNVDILRTQIALLISEHRTKYSKLRSLKKEDLRRFRLEKAHREKYGHFDWGMRYYLESFCAEVTGEDKPLTKAQLQESIASLTTETRAMANNLETMQMILEILLDPSLFKSSPPPPDCKKGHGNSNGGGNNNGPSGGSPAGRSTGGIAA